MNKSSLPLDMYFLRSILIGHYRSYLHYTIYAARTNGYTWKYLKVTLSLAVNYGSV